MSLQQITLETRGSKGIKKEINVNSIDIMMDILQIYTYSMPIESTVRELTSNAVDSQREKEIAIEILTGKAKEEDYFVKKEGKEFDDSKFKKDYYNLEWLDTEHNEVELEYIDKPGSGFCDEFIVRDYGVGVGNGRMKGILELGYSTKRTTKEQIGGFGLGGKSPLSTLTPFFTMVTAYNGNLYKLNIYPKKIDDLIGPINFETEEENDFIVIGHSQDGKPIKVYSEKTDKKNFTEIIVPVKKLNKHKFIDAVSSQLLYINNVRFFVTEEYGRRERDFKATILYNSENIIISNNSRYSRPHIVVVKDKTSTTGICYNEINYKELELEQRYGQVGLKVQIRSVGKDSDGNEIVLQEGVAVTPNREQIIWNDETKRYLLSITKNVANEAAEIINKELVEADFLKWIEKASHALSSVNRGSTLYELSQMIDKSNIIPTYSEDKSVKFKATGDMFWGMLVRNVFYNNTYVRATGSYVKKVERKEIEGWGDFAGLPVYYKLEEKTSNVKDQYILQTQLQDQMSGYQRFVMLELHDIDAMLDRLLEKVTKETASDVEERFNKKREKMLKILEYIKSSSLFRDYDALEVPEDFKVTAEAEEEKVAEIEAKETATLEELRKANGEIVFFTPRLTNSYDYNSGLTWDKMEEKVTAVTAWTSRVFYGFQEDSDTLQCACRILGRKQEDWYNSKIRIVKVAQKNKKHFSVVGEHISNFFYQQDNGCVTMDKEVQKYFTARYITKNVTENKDLNFFDGYDKIDRRLYDIYQELMSQGKRFEDTLKIRSTGNEAEKALFEQLVKYGNFQIFVAENKDDDKAISEKSKELFGTELIKDALLLDMNTVRRVQLLKEYAEPVMDLFNVVACLNTRYYKTDGFRPGTESLIRIVLKDIGLDKFEIPEELLVENPQEKVAESE